MKMIKPHTPAVWLAVYMFAIAVVSLIRTGSPVPLMIAGSFALITFVVALAARKSGRLALNIAIVWVLLIFLVESYMTLFGLQVHGAARQGRETVFGSMAVFALIALILMIILKRREERKRRKQNQSLPQ